MYYVYILLLKNKQIYTGSTNNIRRRLNEHKNGKVKATKQRRPLKIIHYECFTLKTDAQRRESFLKTTEGKRLLRMQIRDLLIKEGVTLRKDAGVV